jgi:hypothetical protein
VQDERGECRLEVLIPQQEELRTSASLDQSHRSRQDDSLLLSRSLEQSDVRLARLLLRVVVVRTVTTNRARAASTTRAAAGEIACAGGGSKCMRFELAISTAIDSCARAH